MDSDKRKGRRLDVIVLLIAGLLVFTFLLVISVSLAVYFTIHPTAREEDYEVSDFDLPSEEIKFLSKDGLVLNGRFVRGETPKTVILVHGYARTYQELLLHADVFHRAGYNVFLFDSRNRGGSEGKFITLGFQEYLDVLGAVEYLKTREEVDENRIGVFGVSLGAVSSIFAAVDGPSIKAAVLEAPFLDLKKVVTRNAKNHFSFSPFFSLLLTPLVYLFARAVFWTLKRKTRHGGRDNVTPKNEVGRIAPRPILFIFDEHDDLIPLEWGVEFFNAAGPPKELWVVHGAEHARALQRAPEEFQKRVTRFFDMYL